MSKKNLSGEGSGKVNIVGNEDGFIGLQPEALARVKRDFINLKLGKKYLKENTHQVFETAVGELRKSMGAIDINTLTVEQYLPLTRRDRPCVVIPKLGNDVDFKIKIQFLSELRCNFFAGTDDEDAHEHLQRVLEITDLFHIPGVTRDAVMLRVFPIILTGTDRRWKNMLLAWVNQYIGSSNESIY
ncbi:hypothetical protein Tco_1005233 [Tanacetum coccineum]|uniref:Uncharacterized protein n=1 Tax=Tanacetum coccineum TaxID=301880 RepID=A0ABQ5FEG8_9ASTR